MNITDLQKFQESGKIRSFKVSVGGNGESAKNKPGDGITAKKSKYSNVKTVVDGIKFDSKREALRYITLKMSEVRHKISVLSLQELIVEDSKGAKTVVYKKKAKLMLKVHGIKINEV